MSSYLDKTGLERVWSKATDKFATIATTDELKGNIETLTSTKADKTEVQAAVANLVDSAPDTLNTLNELAAALGDDPNFATTVSTEIGKKVNKSEYNENIASINANINSINEEIDSLQEASEQHLNKTDYLGPVIIEGNPVTYDNGVEGFDIKVESTFSPKQAGSGDPYPAGGGRNKLVFNSTGRTMNGVEFITNPADGSVTVKGTTNAANTFANLNYVNGTTSLLPPGNYIVSGGTEKVRVEVIINDSVAYRSTGNHVNFTIPENVTNSWVRVQIDATGTQVDTVLYPMIRLATDTDESYAPPSNIRPIIGYDKLDLNRVGKNLIGGWVQGAVNSKGEEFSSSTVIRSAITKVGKRNVYVTVPDGLGYFLVEYADGTFLSRTDRNASQTFTLRDNTTHIRLCLVKNDGSAITPSEAVGYQVEYGTVDTEVVPYQGKLHTVQIGQTVYGFRFDWSTGKGLIEWASYSLTSEKGVSLATSKGNELFYYDFDNMPSTIKGQGTLGFACSHYTVGNILWNDVTMRNKVINTHDDKFQPGFAFALGTYGSVDAWNDFVDAQYAAGTPIQLVWPLANPIEIQLTPTQISELEGINTLYGDGSNIRAIFNTTGGASPVLESISGILPVEKGGTGSTSAAGARNNLGITPQNIGALPIGGGNVTGKIVINGGENYVDLSVIRKINGSEHIACLLPNSTTGSAQLVYVKDGTIKNHLTLNEYNTAFMQPVDIASGGTGANNRHGALTNLCAFGGYTRGDMGDSPNFDNPGMNGLFEVRSISETPNATGIRPFDGFGPLLSLKTPDNIAMLQLAAEVGMGLRFRTKQAGNVTLSGVNWKILLDDANYTAYTVKKDGTGASGTWGISISGNAATATSLSGTLAVNKGGTGITSNPSMLVNLSSTSAASVFAASPRPGITGTLAIGNGGTGATSKSGARTNLGIKSGTSLPSSADAGDIFFLYS